MWQRLQTLWMALAIICMLIYLLLPTGHAGDLGFSTKDDILRAALAVAVMALSLFAITSYRNRKLQMRINLISVALIAAIYVLWLISEERSQEAYTVAWPMFLPGFAILLLLLANRGIGRDERLVKSMDRLR
ncbi:MAG: DUF4293 domain-containing protein [Chitinophagales bacterium]|nr:DUF4293 domain-containing protein [Chitinophagales bacterium]HAE34292.1 hypothetical protein [Bacteroidota bacterium]HPE96622.1 DUF4293 domain-containing protein [Chitinophagales bacterium]HQU38219.1 DUF4293 domain-containing protein [Chitinophagales bacterium]HQU76075.1 DUF4293 domain-containing protein [Chitinophagales bacterium]